MADVRWRLLALIVVVTATKTCPKNQNRLINQNRTINQNQPINQNQLIDQKRLAEIVEQVIKRLHLEWRPSERNLPMFSLAVNVSLGPNGVYDVNAIPDPGDTIREDLLSCSVYKDEYVLAATVKNEECPNWNQNLREEHAEYRVLSRFKAWAAKKPENQTGLMLFYVFASPCPGRCASNMSHGSILPLLKDITEWPQHALVFSKVFKPKFGPPINEGELIKALKNLGSKLGGLENIFRCDTGKRCVSCSRGGGVTPYCYEWEAQGTQWGGRRRRSLRKNLAGEPDVCGVPPLGRGHAEQPQSAKGPTPAKGPGRKTKRGRGQKKTNKRGGTKPGRGRKKTNKIGATRSSGGRRRG